MRTLGDAAPSHLQETFCHGDLSRLSPAAASTVLAEMLPEGNKPSQILTHEDRIRSLHGATNTRLWNVDFLSMIREFATDFWTPQHLVLTQ
jgi:hypothetical protein